MACLYLGEHSTGVCHTRRNPPAAACEAARPRNTRLFFEYFTFYSSFYWYFFFFCRAFINIKLLYFQAADCGLCDYGSGLQNVSNYLDFLSLPGHWLFVYFIIFKPHKLYLRLKVYSLRLVEVIHGIQEENISHFIIHLKGKNRNDVCFSYFCSSKSSVFKFSLWITGCFFFGPKWNNLSLSFVQVITIIRVKESEKNHELSQINQEFKNRILTSYFP